MTRSFRAVAALGALLAGTACSGFLEGDLLDSDPNRPTSATSAQLIVAAQVNNYYIQSGHAARVLAMWTQQMAGTDRQYIGYDQYSVTEGLFGEFTAGYTGGGLVDLRFIQEEAKASGNKTLGGIAKVLEAMMVGFLADNYGAIPYSQAVDPDKNPTPSLDTQASVYAALQTVLDGAIADLSANTGSVGGLDLSFGGDAAKWASVARTLKARYYMHTAETNSGAYALALAQAQQGISSKANDLTSYHSTATGEENIWWQFITRDRDSYTRPGKYLVDLMKTRNDPRLGIYFSRNDGGTYGGAAPGEGLDPIKHSNINTNTRLKADYRQPLVTWAETQGIIAEAAYRGSNLTLARSAMDAIRADAGMSAIGSTLSGSALLTQIMEEKYIALFQSPEAMNDYKRTCYPNVTPAVATAAAGIPARFTYPVAERTANPNIPDVGAQPRRNTNDPVTATSTDGSACKGQK